MSRQFQESAAKTSEAVGESNEEPCETGRKVITFEEEFSKEMVGRSDVANVRKMKAHQKFAKDAETEDSGIRTGESIFEAKSLYRGRA